MLNYMRPSIYFSKQILWRHLESHKICVSFCLVCTLSSHFDFQFAAFHFSILQFVVRLKLSATTLILDKTIHQLHQYNVVATSKSISTHPCFQTITIRSMTGKSGCITLRIHFANQVSNIATFSIYRTIYPSTTVVSKHTIDTNYVQYPVCTI